MGFESLICRVKSSNSGDISFVAKNSLTENDMKGVVAIQEKFPTFSTCSFIKGLTLLVYLIAPPSEARNSEETELNVLKPIVSQRSMLLSTEQSWRSGAPSPEAAQNEPQNTKANDRDCQAQLTNALEDAKRSKDELEKLSTWKVLFERLGASTLIAFTENEKILAAQRNQYRHLLLEVENKLKLPTYKGPEDRAKRLNVAIQLLLDELDILRNAKPVDLGPGGDEECVRKLIAAQESLRDMTEKFEALKAAANEGASNSDLEDLHEKLRDMTNKFKAIEDCPSKLATTRKELDDLEGETSELNRRYQALREEGEINLQARNRLRRVELERLRHLYEEEIKTARLLEELQCIEALRDEGARVNPGLKIAFDEARAVFHAAGSAFSGALQTSYNNAVTALQQAGDNPGTDKRNAVLLAAFGLEEGAGRYMNRLGFAEADNALRLAGEKSNYNLKEHVDEAVRKRRLPIDSGKIVNVPDDWNPSDVALAREQAAAARESLHEQRIELDTVQRQLNMLQPQINNLQLENDRLRAELSLGENPDVIEELDEDCKKQLLFTRAELWKVRQQRDGLVSAAITYPDEESGNLIPPNTIGRERDVWTTLRLAQAALVVLRQERDGPPNIQSKQVPEDLDLIQAQPTLTSITGNQPDDLRFLLVMPVNEVAGSGGAREEGKRNIRVIQAHIQDYMRARYADELSSTKNLYRDLKARFENLELEREKLEMERDRYKKDLEDRCQDRLLDLRIQERDARLQQMERRLLRAQRNHLDAVGRYHDLEEQIDADSATEEYIQEIDQANATMELLEDQRDRAYDDRFNAFENLRRIGDLQVQTAEIHAAELADLQAQVQQPEDQEMIRHFRSINISALRAEVLRRGGRLLANGVLERSMYIEAEWEAAGQDELANGGVPTQIWDPARTGSDGQPLPRSQWPAAYQPGDPIIAPRAELDQEMRDKIQDYIYTISCLRREVIARGGVLLDNGQVEREEFDQDHWNDAGVRQAEGRPRLHHNPRNGTDINNPPREDWPPQCQPGQPINFAATEQFRDLNGHIVLLEARIENLRAEVIRRGGRVVGTLGPVEGEDGPPNDRDPHPGDGGGSGSASSDENEKGAGRVSRSVIERRVSDTPQRPTSVTPLRRTRSDPPQLQREAGRRRRRKSFRAAVQNSSEGVSRFKRNESEAGNGERQGSPKRFRGSDVDEGK